MNRARAAQVIVRHLWHVWRGGQLRFRLETFGLYYPALPYRSPIWRFPLANALLLVRQSGEYARWIVEMDAIQRGGPDGWWDRA